QSRGELVTELRRKDQASLVVELGREGAEEHPGPPSLTVTRDPKPHLLPTRPTLPHYPPPNASRMPKMSHLTAITAGSSGGGRWGESGVERATACRRTPDHRRQGAARCGECSPVRLKDAGHEVLGRAAPGNAVEVEGSGGSRWSAVEIRGNGRSRWSDPRRSAAHRAAARGATVVSGWGRQRAGPCAPRGDTRSAPARRSRGAAVVEFRGGSEAVVTRALLPALFHLLHEAAAVAPRRVGALRAGTA